MGKSKIIDKLRTKKSKLFAVLIIILFIIPVFFSIYAYGFRNKIKVGIVITKPEIELDGLFAAECLNEYDDIFTARLLDVYFNESDVRVKDNLYLTDDYFDPDFAEEIRNDHDVDIIFILTRKSINNWLGNGLALWGQANTELSMCMGTVKQFMDDPGRHEDYMTHLVVHEVLHLLGYLHDSGDKACIMQYATIDTELCTECRTELLLRTAIWKIGQGLEPGRGALAINTALYTIYATPVLAVIGLTHVTFKKNIYRKEKIKPDPLIYSVGFLFINILLISVFINSLYARLVSLGMFVFVYFLVEMAHYQYQEKKAN